MPLYQINGFVKASVSVVVRAENEAQALEFAAQKWEYHDLDASEGTIEDPVVEKVLEAPRQE